MPHDVPIRQQEMNVSEAFGEGETKTLVKANEVIKVKGMPKIVDKHQMNNKRFILTLDEEDAVELWKLDELSCVKKFPGEKFSDVKEHLQ